MVNLDPEIESSLTKVLKALQEFSAVYDRKIDELRMKGLPAEKLRPILDGSEAMKDSASIYLSWAKFYMEKISNPMAEKESESYYKEL
jgi:hypothetical protein